MVKIKLGTRAPKGVKIPVSVPVISIPAVSRFAILDVAQFQVNNPDGLILSDEDYADALANTDLQSKIDAGLVAVTLPEAPPEV